MMLQRQKQLSHLEKELTDAAVEDNRQLRLRLVSVSLQTVNIFGLSVSPIVFHATLSEWLKVFPDGNNGLHTLCFIYYVLIHSLVGLLFCLY